MRTARQTYENWTDEGVMNALYLRFLLGVAPGAAAAVRSGAGGSALKVSDSTSTMSMPSWRIAQQIPRIWMVVCKGGIGTRDQREVTPLKIALERPVSEH